MPHEHNRGALSGFSPAELAEALDLSLEAVGRALEVYNRIVEADVDPEVKALALRLASELPGARDIGPHFSEVLVELGPVEELGDLSGVRGIGPVTLGNAARALAEADPEEALSRAEEELGGGPRLPDLPEIESIGTTGELVEQPWFTGVMPGQIVAVEGAITPLTHEGEEIVFVVDSDLAPGHPGAFPLALGDFPVSAVPAGPVTLVGLGLPSGAVQPLVFGPALGVGGVLLGFDPKVVIVHVNLRVFRAVLALKEQVRRILLDLFRLFGFDPDDPNLRPGDKGSQLLKIEVLKLALFKEKLDLEAIEALIEALEKCKKKLEGGDAEDKKAARKLAKALNGASSALQLKRMVLRFWIEKNLCGVEKGQTLDEKMGMDDWDREIVEKLIELLKALEKSVDKIGKVRKKMGELSPGTDTGAGSSASGPSAEKLKKELDKIEKEAEERRRKFKEEQKKKIKKLEARIQNACAPGNVDRLVRDLKLQLGALIDRNRHFNGIIRGSLVPEELAAVKRGRRLLERMDEFLRLEREAVEEAIKREKEAIKQARAFPELHVKKLKIFMDLLDCVKEQLEAFGFGGVGGTLDFGGGGDEVPDTLDGLLREKKEEAEALKKQLEGVEKKLEQAKKDLRGG